MYLNQEKFCIESDISYFGMSSRKSWPSSSFSFIHIVRPRGRANVTLDRCPVGAFGPAAEFFVWPALSELEGMHNLFTPILQLWKQVYFFFFFFFERLVGGAQLLCSREWLTQPVVSVLDSSALLWLFRCLQHCLGWLNRIAISERGNFPICYLVFCTLSQTHVNSHMRIGSWTLG